MVYGSFCLIVPTRDRPRDIRTLLHNLSSQTIQPIQIVIIDSSAIPQPELVQEYTDLPIQYLAFQGEPSAAAQRNAGLACVDDDADLIGFVDDDIVFEPDAFEKMLAFWRTAPADVRGAAFNLQEEETKATGGKLKHSRFAKWLGLYDPEPGAVAPSGWHTRLGAVSENTRVEWLISGAVLWRKQVLLNHQFDAFFKGYSYLEDLDFSYSAGRNGQLVVVADAVFRHHHHHENLSSDWYYRFGQMEVRNRLYFVRKHGLSVWRCYLGLCIRFGQTLVEVAVKRQPVLLSRARGNLAGLWKSLFLSNPDE